MFEGGKFNASTILVVAPLAHLGAVSLYLYFYCLGFGGNISAFVRPGDLFSASMQDMLRIYISSLLIPVAITAIRHLSGTPFAHVAIDRLEGGAREAALLRHDKTKKSILFLSILILSIGVFGSLWKYYNREYLSIFSIWFSASPIFYILMYINRHKIPVGDVVYDIFVIVLAFIFSAISSSVDFGHYDRVSKYVDDVRLNSRCDDGAVRRKIGEMYLATMPDDSKALLDSNCKPIIFVPNRSVDEG